MDRYGYWNKILHVDLTSRTTSVEEPGDRFFRLYGGGRGVAELKRAGWGAIVVRGVASSPVYLWINEDRVEIRDAAHLWGKITGDVQAQIREELDDPRIRVAQIGPAGEHLVRFANIMNDLTEAAGPPRPG